MPLLQSKQLINITVKYFIKGIELYLTKSLPNYLADCDSKQNLFTQL